VTDSEKNIEALLSEKRVFEPSPAFVDRANVSDRSLYDRASADPDGFWAEQAERISRIIRAFLTLARGGSPSLSHVDPRALARVALDLVEHRFAQAHVTLLHHLEAKLPAVVCDAALFEQVLVNLLLNACDACSPGGSVELRAESRGNRVAFLVEDDGTGISAEAAERCLEPLFTTKAPGKGTGLGLAMVYGTVKQSGGFIWVYSEPNRGTAFKVYLPITEETRDGARVSAPPETAVRGEETILLVEDEEPVRALARRMLEAAGYKVLEARQGAEALKIAETFADPIHLVLTDTVMPGMGGPELVGHLAASHPETRTLFMSGYAGDAVLRHGILDGGASFLQKPFTSGVLTRRVREVLDRRRA